MDDTGLSSEINPPLTTVRIKVEEIGRVSLDKIIRLINNDYHGKIKTIINNELVIRKSCRNLNIK